MLFWEGGLGQNSTSRIIPLDSGLRMVHHVHFPGGEKSQPILRLPGRAVIFFSDASLMVQCLGG